MAKIKNESNLTPLTKEQLQEALLYIIKVSSKVRSTKKNELSNLFFSKNHLKKLHKILSLQTVKIVCVFPLFGVIHS